MIVKITLPHSLVPKFRYLKWYINRHDENKSYSGAKTQDFIMLKQETNILKVWTPIGNDLDLTCPWQFCQELRWMSFLNFERLSQLYWINISMKCPNMSLKDAWLICRFYYVLQREECFIYDCIWSWTWVILIE